ncbi:MAG: hypothetical protein WDW36_005901 [Sanguina aurantia]
MSNGMADYYVLLGVDDDCTPEELKQAYRGAAKECHPDYLGETGHNICVLLNEAYDTLSDAGLRSQYNAKLEQALVDNEDKYTGKTMSKWIPELAPRMAKNTEQFERRGVFVDEFTCIGCKQCMWCASATFRVEPEYGRSRVFAQWLDTEDNIQAAIDSCPVTCITWEDKADLPALEWVMQTQMTQRVGVGIMQGGQGASMDVFAATRKFLKERKQKEEARSSDKGRYSAAQDGARRRAAEKLKQRNAGWFGAFTFEGVFQSAMSSMDESMGYRPLSLDKVGSRKRAVRWDAASRRANAAMFSAAALPTRTRGPATVFLADPAAEE